MYTRVTGLETEYGCLVESPLEVRRVLASLRDWVFSEGYGLLDCLDRDWDEPAGNGGFLFNGGRLYLDLGHLEYCTPECRSVQELLHYSVAGDALLTAAIDSLGWRGKVRLFRNNIDHHTGATFGCHENYSLLRSAPLSEENIASLLTFLTLRVLFAGSGRVGSANPFRSTIDGSPPPPRARFQISQRADHVHHDFFEWVQHNRAIINTRDEPLADPDRYRRLHLLHGDTNVLPAASALKIGATHLVLDLLEADALPAVGLADAVGTFKALSRQPIPPWSIVLADGTPADAIAVLGAFRRAAEQLPETPERKQVLDLWKQVECGLANPASLVGLLDWPTKERLLEAFRKAENLSWEASWLEAQDLEYHAIDPRDSLATLLADTSGWWANPAPRDCLREPPPDTRARARVDLMRRLEPGSFAFQIDWDSVESAQGWRIELPDPLANHHPLPE